MAIDRSTESTMSSGDPSQHQRVGIALGLRILSHPDLTRVDEIAVLFDDARPGRATLSRFEPVFRRPDGRATAPLATSRVSRRPIQLAKHADGSMTVATQEGTSAWIDERPLADKRRLLPQELQAGVTLRLGSYVLLWLGQIEVEPEQTALQELRGASSIMRALRAEIARVADLPISVLLRGETGVGKELVATALHRLSQRHKGPMISVNMAAVPAPMAASELFGHVKGAFTGAGAARVGYFAEARRGTLFLDEIGETASDVQPMLLRALEQGVIQPLGGKPEHVDVRLIAATDSDLEAAVAAGRFKAPLLRRFGYEIHVPPLRRRREDIGSLFATFLKQELEALGESHRLSAIDPDRTPWVPASFVALLVSHDWPGNVRELRNATRRFAVHNRGRERAAVDVEFLRLLGLTPPSAPDPDPPTPSRAQAGDLSDEQIAIALRKNAYVVEATAAELGVSRSWLHQHLNDSAAFRKAKDLRAPEIRAALERADGDLARAALELRVSARGLQLQMTRLGPELEADGWSRRGDAPEET